MKQPKDLETLIGAVNPDNFRWMDPHEVVIAQWVRMKCRFGCKDYGKAAACPPYTLTLPECERFFGEYREGALLHFRKQVAKPGDRHAWTRTVNSALLKLERAVFLAGYHKAFVIYVDPCNFCAECPDNPADCSNNQIARPSLEGLGVDVFATVRKAGLSLNVLTDTNQAMDRYGMILVE
jgi:predicted metal-binding protein